MWTTDTFSDNLVIFSALSGQEEHSFRGGEDDKLWDFDESS